MDGRLVIVENGELIAVYNAKTTMNFDPKTRIKAPLDVVPLSKEDNQRMDIRCCTSFKIGLMFVCGDSCVYYYEKTSDHRFVGTHNMDATPLQQYIGVNSIGFKNETNI